MIISTEKKSLCKRCNADMKEKLPMQDSYKGSSFSFFRVRISSLEKKIKGLKRKVWSWKLLKLCNIILNLS